MVTSTACVSGERTHPRHTQQTIATCCNDTISCPYLRVYCTTHTIPVLPSTESGDHAAYPPPPPCVRPSPQTITGAALKHGNRYSQRSTQPLHSLITRPGRGQQIHSHSATHMHCMHACLATHRLQLNVWMYLLYGNGLWKVRMVGPQGGRCALRLRQAAGSSPLWKGRAVQAAVATSTHCPEMREVRDTARLTPHWSHHRRRVRPVTREDAPAWRWTPQHTLLERLPKTIPNNSAFLYQKHKHQSPLPS